MIWFKGCPRCKGDLYLDKDIYGWYRRCLQCGYMQDLTAPFVPGLPGTIALSGPGVYWDEDGFEKVRLEIEGVEELAVALSSSGL